jgi:hypothetical protein
MSTSKSAPASPTAAREAIAGVGELPRNVQDQIATAMDFSKKLMACNLGAGAELLTFMSRRMKAQADLFSGAFHCRDIAEAADIQRKFLEKVREDYTEEMSHLADMARRNFETMSGFTNGHGKDAEAARRPM